MATKSIKKLPFSTTQLLANTSFSIFGDPCVPTVVIIIFIITTLCFDTVG